VEGVVVRYFGRPLWFADWECYRIQTWALEEARRRLEAEGILEDEGQKK
jgi:hypothetical protein